MVWRRRCTDAQDEENLPHLWELARSISESAAHLITQAEFFDWKALDAAIGWLTFIMEKEGHKSNGPAIAQAVETLTKLRGTVREVVDEVGAPIASTAEGGTP
jgi:hypothetical protein